MRTTLHAMHQILFISVTDKDHFPIWMPEKHRRPRHNRACLTIDAEGQHDHERHQRGRILEGLRVGQKPKQFRPSQLGAGLVLDVPGRHLQPTLGGEGLQLILGAAGVLL